MIDIALNGAFTPVAGANLPSMSTIARCMATFLVFCQRQVM
jgi:hypothetical protein